MKRIIFLPGLLLGLACPASADVFNVPPPFLMPIVGAPYTGPGDIVATWSMYYASRAFSSATRGNKIWNVCDAPNTTCADVVTSVVTGLPVIGTIGATNCAASATCTIKTWYDLTGNGNDNTQTTAANRATLNAAAIGGKACGVLAGTTTGYPTAYVAGTDINQPYTYSVVAERTGALSTVQYIMSSSGGTSGLTASQLDFSTTPIALLYSGVGANTINQAATDNAPHTVLAMVNGASSKISVDGATVTTGDTGSGVANTSMGIGRNAVASGNNLVGIFCEGGLAPTDQSANAAALYTNQHIAYGF